MVRRRRKKALYEVIGTGEVRPNHDRSVRHREGGEEGGLGPERGVVWSGRPKLLRFGTNRLELSLPYQLVIAVLLGVILLLLVVFRLGQSSPSEDRLAEQMSEAAQQESPASVATESGEVVSADGRKLLSAEEAAAEARKGNNRIVIQTYQVRSALEPVKQYFAGLGIETEIRKIEDWYYLVTTNKYESPERVGTDGYLVKQKIIELGAGYKAPQGYESFGSRPFHDAYGMKFDD
jgi:hypothetical protein